MMSGRDEQAYDAFVSYSHAGDGKLAPALQAGIEKFAKPWYRVRALRVFRDQTSLSANPGLWPSIEKALSRSAWFLLLASPEAAASPWVAKEIQWWLEHRSANRLLIVLTSGTLHWDDAIGDFGRRSTALPAVLREAFAEQPRWVDASWDDDAALASRANPHLQDVIAEVASTIRGVPKDELVGLHVSEHRRTMRWVAGATGALASMLIVSIIATVVAVDQRDIAIAQRNVALGRQLAAVSTSELGTNLDVAHLLAARAYRTDANPQTRAALLQALIFSPHLVRYLPAGGEVRTLAGSSDGTTVVAGLSDGKVKRWTLVDPAPKEIFALPAEVSSLAINRDGTVVLASGGSAAVLWHAGRQPMEITLPRDQHAGPVAVSPSGRTGFVATREPVFEGRQSIAVVDVHSGATSITTHEVRDMPAVSSLVASWDDHLFLLDGGYGFWQRRRIPDWTLLIGSKAGFGVRNYAFGTSDGGGWFSYTNGDPRIPVWRTDRPSDPDDPEFTAHAPISRPESLTLSPAGTHLAVADSGVIHVSPVARRDAPRKAAIQLIGHGSINPDGVRFLRDGSHLISASREKIALWDLTQSDRISRTARVAVRPSCRACPGPSLRVAPDGQQIAIVDGNGESAILVALDDMSRPAVRMPTHMFRYRYGLPVWDAASRYVVLPVSSLPGGSRVVVPDGLPATVRAWPAGEGSDVVVAAALASDAKTSILVNTSGQIRFHDAETGRLRRTIPGPAELAGEANALQTNTGSAAVDSSSAFVALVVKGSVSIVDVAGASSVGSVPGNDAASVAFSGRRLLVQRANGTVEVWSARGSTKEREIAGDDSYGWAVPVGNQQGTVVARQRSNGSIVLADLDTGAIIGTFPPGPGSPARKTGIAFSPDGSRLITVIEGGDREDALLVVRDLSADALVRTACATAGRALTSGEWQAFVGTAAPEDLGCP
jgi:WD40 repeat protein